MAGQIRLQRIEGEPVTLHFSPDYARRARTIGALVEEAHHFLATWLEVEAHTTVSVLRRTNWRDLRRAPYGFPHSSPERSIIYVPATCPPYWLEQARVLWLDAPPALQQQLCDDEAGLDEAIRRFYDLVAVHELGHLFIHHLQLALGSRWLVELTANLFATAFFLDRRPALARCWLAWAEIQASQPVPHRDLVAFETQYTTLTFANASFYQGRFNLRAAQLWEEHGRALAPRLIAEFGTGPRAVAARWARVVPGWEWEIG